MEYEANVFAAEFMLSDDTVLEALEMQMDFYPSFQRRETGMIFGQITNF